MKLTTLITLLSLLTWNGSNGSNPSSPQVEKAPPPFRLKLTIQSTKVCLGEPIKVQVELINVSDKEEVVDVKNVWYRMSFSYFRNGQDRINPDGSGSGTDTIGSLTRVGDPGPNYKGQYITLHPGQSHKEARSIKLGEDFFKQSGAYTVTVAYGQFQDDSLEGIKVWRGTVESDALKFKVVTCKTRVRK
jgi:hypothetical protein